MSDKRSFIPSLPKKRGNNMKKWSTLSVVSLLLLLTPVYGMTPSMALTGIVHATADISGPGGITGTAFFVEDGKGDVLVTVFVKGDPTILTPGKHGVHIHEVGACDAPGF